jgi:tetratricopeptide (TPR) repeat protein
VKRIVSCALTVLVFALAAGSRPCGAASVTQRYEEAAQLLDAWQFEEAFRLAHVLLNENPQAPLALSLMGRVQYYLGNYGLALRYLSQSPKRVPVKEGTFSSLRH